LYLRSALRKRTVARPSSTRGSVTGSR
jgi:hypothetical protein